ncbi:putative cyclin domain-containing protein [Helianthus annuus]|nr:putative cyclin domain-containing protein [Helianthus annuus]
MTTLLDSLYCEEKHQWEDEEDEPLDSYSCVVDDDDDDDNDNNNIHHSQHTLLQQDLFWEHQELPSLISKESHCHLNTHHVLSGNHRRHAVEWMLEVVSHYSFSALTAVLAVNYLDRFFENFEELETEKKPWMTQLAAVSCLSLAAKVEETHVPLLLDLQLDGSRYVFEAKTIQKMEILILSTLEWRMNPVTPLSFVDYITRRLGLKTYLSSEFVKRCECLLLCFLPDDRFRYYLPSVIATATMVHVINSIEPCIGVEFQSQLLGILGINKDVVEECWKDIQEVTCGRKSGRSFYKRKFGSVPGSPDAVMDLSFSSDESWWSVVNPNPNPSVSSSPELGSKKSRKGAT